MQTIKYIKQHNSNYIKFVNLLCDGCHKQAVLISESHSDSNRYTPCKGKPAQHDTYVSHASPRTPDVRFPRAVPVHDNLSRVVDIFGWIPLLPRKRAPDTIHSMSADRFMGPYPVSLLSQPMKQ
jgi:hypothetical protein